MTLAIQLAASVITAVRRMWAGCRARSDRFFNLL